MSITEKPLAQTAPAESLFERIVVGVDGSEPGYEAARQAARLVEPEGTLELFTAVHLAEAALAGWSAPKLGEKLWAEAEETIRYATGIAGPRAATKLVDGPVRISLAHELAELDATLVVVGTHGFRRLPQILLGGVATDLLHNAPCSVYVARPPAIEALFPRAIVAGYDGSPGSEAAVEVAQHLADRFRASASVVTASGGKHVDLTAARTRGAKIVDARPVSALVDAGSDADLIVVGSRGLHGLKALGSVSERVAHQAGCSVLVVRPHT
jgi:nucleotide-binding universal stress UspA family protein